MYDNQMFTHKQFLQLMNKTTSEQLKQIMNVLSKNNVNETHDGMNMENNLSIYFFEVDCGFQSH